MKKHLNTLVLLLLLLQISFAQATIKPKNMTLKGRVTDVSTSRPVVGATVFIPDLKLGAITDTNGEFVFNKLPRGNYLIEIKSVGFKPASRSIYLNGVVTEDFKLSEDFVEGGEVVVTGSSQATLIRKNPIPIVAVSHDYLVQNISTNAMDALAKVPGIRTVTTGPNISKPFIRGLGYNRILTLYDGLRQEGQQWGDEHGVEVDQYAVDRIEVIKGPASLSYGSDALAGVINIIPTPPAPEGKMLGDFTLDYHTNNKNVGGSAMLGATKNGIEWMARISHKQATNYQNRYDGRVFGTAYKETNANLSLGIHRDWGYSHLHFVLFDDTQEVPDGSRDSATRRFTRPVSEDSEVPGQIVSDKDLNAYAIEHIHQRVQHYRVYLNNNFIIGSGRLALNLGYQKSVRREFSHPVLYTIPGLYLQLNTFNYDLKYRFQDFDNWNLTTGINGMVQNNDVTKGTEFIIPNYRQFDIGAFMTAKKSFNKLDISGGLRYDIRSFKNSELFTRENPETGFEMAVSGTDTADAEAAFSKYSNTFSGLTGSLGATYNFSDKFSVKANISRGFRAPNISEISSHGVHPGTNMYQLGNPDFKSEFSLQQDIGFDFVSKYLVASISVFNNTISNYIFNQKVTNADGSDLIIVPGTQTFQFQASRARLYGGEISVDFHPVKAMHFENSFSVVYGNNKGTKGKLVEQDARYLPFIPPAHGLSEVRMDFHLPSLRITKGFLKAQVEYYTAQNRAYTAFDTETPTPGYALFNAGLGGSITNKKGKTLFNISIMGNNLFDLGYQDHLSRLKYFEPYPGNYTGRNGIYNMGRNINFKINVPLNISLKS